MRGVRCGGDCVGGRYKGQATDSPHANEFMDDYRRGIDRIYSNGGVSTSATPTTASAASASTEWHSRTASICPSSPNGALLKRQEAIAEESEVGYLRRSNRLCITLYSQYHERHANASTTTSKTYNNITVS